MGEWSHLDDVEYSEWTKDDFISLKWGTLKGWNLENSPEAFEILKKWGALGESMSAMFQDDTTEQKELICEMIDKVNGPVYRAWEHEFFESREDAKKYVREYGKK